MKWRDSPKSGEDSPRPLDGRCVGTSKEIPMTPSLKPNVGVLSVVVLTLLAGCKAEEAKPSGFIEDAQLMSYNPDTPFNRTYWNKDYNSRDYDELMVAPVNTQYVMAQNIWEKTNLVNVRPEQLRDDINALASYTRQSFVRAATNDPKKRFKVVETAGPKTLVLELALVQVVPSKAALNALGYVTWVPAVVTAGGAAATDSQDAGKGVIAIEGRIRDGATGKIIGLFADRERPKTAIIDIKSLNWWAPLKAIVDEWSQQLIALANRPPGAAVKENPNFELLVW
jgi:hypothetical protein